MFRFIESIRLNDGKLGNLDYLRQRMDRAHDEFFPTSPKIDLNGFLNSCPMPSVGLHKVRLVYDSEVQSVQISTYRPKVINKLKIIISDSITYSHKFENRNELEELFLQRTDCEDIIIVKQNKITDTSFANVVFKREGKWFTPQSCLLNGTMRQQLLDQKKIFKEEIGLADLKKFEKVKLINSMLQFDAPEIDVSQIVE
ncbi:MAG: aminotransferase class IV [Bacteroidetes bacterium]|nr:aminotransferase class IV [Bacteroidota bacterium]